MNNPIEIMYAEHEIIKKAENVITDLKDQWEKYPGQYLASVKTLLSFFREYADGYHHHKEEEVLFPAILNHPDFAIPDMVEGLLHHHEEFREYARDIQDALENGDYADSYKYLTNYIRDLNDHISAEDDELFVLAENLFDQQQLDSIYFRFKDIDMELGEARKEALEEMIMKIDQNRSIEIEG